MDLDLVLHLDWVLVFVFQLLFDLPWTCGLGIGLGLRSAAGLVHEKVNFPLRLVSLKYSCYVLTVLVSLTEKNVFKIEISKFLKSLGLLSKNVNV